MSAMRELGYDYSLLFGISDYYHRFGYCQAWPAMDLRVDVADLPQPPLRLSLSERRLSEIQCGQGAVMDIYNRDNAFRTGTAEQPIYSLSASPYWKDFRLDALVDAGGQTVGYLAHSKSGQELTVMEVGGLDESCGLDQIIAAIREVAKRSECSHVLVACFSYQHPLVQALRQGTCKVEMRHRLSGGAMGAVVNLHGCLKAMEEELSWRVAHSGLKDTSTSLAVDGQGETVTLAISPGHVRVTSGQDSRDRIICGAISARLILGSEAPAALVHQGVKYQGHALALTEVLFPQQWPLLHRLDGF
jgi:hypothetical protein